jgi:hypothetical protein
MGVACVTFYDARGRAGDRSGAGNLESGKFVHKVRHGCELMGMAVAAESA